MTTNADKLVEFTLKPEEQKLILNSAIAVDDELKRKLRFGVHEGKDIVFSFSPHDYSDLLDALAAESNDAEPRRLRREFERIYDKLVGFARMEPSVFEDFLEYATNTLPPQIRDGFLNLLRTKKLENIDDLNKEIANLCDDLNLLSHVDMSGLSPEQVNNLICSDWSKPDSAVVLNRGLSVDVLAGSDFLFNTRALLAAIAKVGVVKTTQTGNLNRKFVAQMMDELKFAEGYIDDAKKYHKVHNEDDIRPLRVVRAISTMAGLLRKECGEIKITAKGRRLSTEPMVGELFALLFCTFFQVFELSNMDRMEECPGVQDTVAYSLYVISRHCNEWLDVQKLKTPLFLPAVAETIPIIEYGDYTVWLATSRLLNPLLNFGLLEFQYQDRPKPFGPELKSVRKTPLFDQFLSFRI